MKYFIYLLFAIIFINSCVTTRSFDSSNICSIFKSNPQWKIITENTKKKWGTPVSLQLAFIKQESSFEKNAKPSRKKFLGVIPSKRISTAYGYSQALDGTWNDYKISTGNSDANRKNFKDASDFIGWYVDGTYKLLKIQKTDIYNNYLAYHEGRGGYQKKTFNKKKWLLTVAKKVEKQAILYSNQIKNCKFSNKKNSVL